VRAREWHEDQALGERLMREQRQAEERSRLVDVGALITERAEVLARVLEADPHSFGSRPCSTCTTASALLGRPFGCSAKARR
jgi:hypothetical protein